MMKSVLILALLAPFAGCAQGTMGGSATKNIGSGTPTPSVLKSTSSATTIAAQITMTAPATPSMACGTSPGTYTKTSADSGVFMGTGIVAQQIVAGLVPSTTYYCQITATNVSGSGTATFSLATTAAASTTAITTATVGSVTQYNATFTPQTSGDTYYNAVGPDGTVYVMQDDTATGWTGGSCTVSPGASNMQIGTFTGTFPSTVCPLNNLTAFGVNGAQLTPNPLGGSEKVSCLWAQEGKVFIFGGRQYLDTGAIASGFGFAQWYAHAIWSGDRGASWNSFQQVGTFLKTGNLTTTTPAMLGNSGPSTYASAGCVMYGADDGTLGYFTPELQRDNADAYVYFIANEGYWNNGSNYYIARVARAKISNLVGSDYQFYKGGADGSLDAAWDTDPTLATPILTAANQLSEPNIQYVPSLNRYIMLGFYYPTATWETYPTTTYDSNSQWPIWESAHPWGPWTLVTTVSWTGNASSWYNPVVYVPSIQTGCNPYILFSGRFTTGLPAYQMSWARLAINGGSC